MHRIPPMRRAKGPRIFCRRFLGFFASLVLSVRFAAAQVIEGPDWAVCFSLPSQSTNLSLPGEFSIRDRLTAQIDQLQQGHAAALATFTLSGDSLQTGAAASILAATSRALDRGASVHFVGDSMIKPAKEFQPGLSLRRLSRRPVNPLALSISPKSTLMHHKTAIFDYGDDDQCCFVASGNFTGAANTRQWNIALLVRNPDLYRAFAAEMNEFRQGRFGPKKQRNHDRTPFRLQDSWGTCWVRFAPFPSSPGGPVNAETDIRRLIDDAEEEIVFAMHRFNRAPLRRALVAAANRGIRVRGVIPESDRGTNQLAISGPTARYFANPANYTGTNRVELLPVRVRADGPEWDAGEQDLAHTKYALIDPNGRRPFVIHGAANWTISGLVDPNGNDESILFLRHRGIAQAFLAQFHRMTGTRAEALPDIPLVARAP